MSIMNAVNTILFHFVKEQTKLLLLKEYKVYKQVTTCILLNVAFLSFIKKLYCYADSDSNFRDHNVLWTAAYFHFSVLHPNHIF